MPDGDDEQDADAAADTDAKESGAADAAVEQDGDTARDDTAAPDAAGVPADTAGGWRRRPAVLILVIGLIAVAATTVVLMQPADGPDGDQPPADYAGADEERGQVTDAPADATVTIDSDGVAPARVTVDVGGTVRWRNRRPDTVSLSFDRIDGTETVAPGETLTMQFSGITYYTVSNAAGDRIGRGRINVQ